MGLKHAVGKEMIPRSPCEFCKPPKRRKTDINALDRDQRSKMLTITRSGTPTPLNLAIEIALTTGMRRGEVCGLRWSNLSEDGSISANRSIGEGKGGFYVKTPKTPGSIRTIPLVSLTFTRLAAMKSDY